MRGVCQVEVDGVEGIGLVFESQRLRPAVSVFTGILTRWGLLGASTDMLLDGETVTLASRDEADEWFEAYFRNSVDGYIYVQLPDGRFVNLCWSKQDQRRTASIEEAIQAVPLCPHDPTMGLPKIDRAICFARPYKAPDFSKMK